jgi:hypothetical protein
MLKGAGLRWIVRPNTLSSHFGMNFSQAFPTGYDRSCATIEEIRILGRRSASSMLMPDPIVVKTNAIVHMRTVF